MKIEIMGIKKQYYNKVIFDNLSMTINSGDFVCIYGKSGYGKSTLLGIIGLIDKKYEGNVFYDDTLINSDKQRQELLNQKISFIFQDFNLIEHLSVKDNIVLLENLLDNEINWAYFDLLLKYFKLERIVDNKVVFLSGGEKQRVAIVRALIKNPDVIIADEPTGNLDKDNKYLLDDFLTKINKIMNKTIILVTHDDFFAKESRNIIRL